MPIPIKYTTTNVSSSVRLGNIALGVNAVDYGPSSTTNWANAVPPLNGGYAIYYYSGTALRMRTAADDTTLITVAGQIMGTTYASAAAALSGLAAGGFTVVYVNPPNIVTNGLVLNMNAGLVMSYPRTNLTWYDISGNAYNGTLTNGTTFNSTTNSMVFDGTDDIVDVSSPASLNPGNNDFTIDYLCYVNSSAGASCVIEARGDGLWGFLGIAYYPGGYISLFLNNVANGANNQNVYLSTTAPVQRGVWFHTAIVVNRNTNQITFYYNGIQVGSPVNTVSGTIAGGGYRYWIGGDLGGSPMNGNIAAYRQYNRTLSASEVLQNYYQGNIVTDNLSYVWDAGNLISYPGSGTTTYNMTGSINGTLQNGVAFNSGNGGYWSFDGSDDRILLDNANYSFSLGDGNSNWTVNAWVKTTTSANGLGAGPILSNSNGGPVYSEMGINGGKIVYWVYPSNINSWKGWTGNITVNDGKWHMLTWVNKVGYTMDMYVDGVLDVTISPTNAGNNNPIDIIGGCWASNFQGDIATVQVYQGKAFNLSEVQQNFNACKNRFNL
jgi:hypothetical protein